MAATGTLALAGSKVEAGLFEAVVRIATELEVDRDGDRAAVQEVEGGVLPVLDD